MSLMRGGVSPKPASRESQIPGPCLFASKACQAGHAPCREALDGWQPFKSNGPSCMHSLGQRTCQLLKRQDGGILALTSCSLAVAWRMTRPPCRAAGAISAAGGHRASQQRPAQIEVHLEAQLRLAGGIGHVRQSAAGLQRSSLAVGGIPHHLSLLTGLRNRPQTATAARA